MAAVKRDYVAPRREESARATRLAILQAASELFVAQGYAATTVDQIARRARVSRPTVFAIGGKAELLRLVRDLALAGDDEPRPVADRESFQMVLDAPDPEQALRLEARHAVQLASRYADIDEVLRQAAGGDEQLRDLWEAAEQQRRVGAQLVIDSVVGKGKLRHGLDVATAVDVLWLLTAPDHLRRMLRQGWSAAQYEQWLAETLCVCLLP